MNAKVIKQIFAAVAAAIGSYSPACAQSPPQQVQTEAPTFVKELTLWFHNNFGADRTGRLDISEISVLPNGEITALMSMKTLSGAPGKGRDGCVLMNAPAKGLLVKGKMTIQPTIAPGDDKTCRPMKVELNVATDGSCLSLPHESGLRLGGTYVNSRAPGGLECGGKD